MPLTPAQKLELRAVQIVRDEGRTLTARFPNSWLPVARRLFQTKLITTLDATGCYGGCHRRSGCLAVITEEEEGFEINVPLALWQVLGALADRPGLTVCRDAWARERWTPEALQVNAQQFTRGTDDGLIRFVGDQHTRQILIGRGINIPYLCSQIAAAFPARRMAFVSHSRAEVADVRNAIRQGLRPYDRHRLSPDVDADDERVAPHCWVGTYDGLEELNGQLQHEVDLLVSSDAGQAILRERPAWLQDFPNAKLFGIL